MSDVINYSELMKRAENVAAEIMEDAETLDDAMDRVVESCDWDWTIYNGMAMELCANVPNDLLSEAEEMVQDCGSVTSATGLSEHATMVAYWIVWGAVSRCVERLIEAEEMGA